MAAANNAARISRSVKTAWWEDTGVQYNGQYMYSVGADFEILISDYETFCF